MSILVCGVLSFFFGLVLVFLSWIFSGLWLLNWWKCCVVLDEWLFELIFFGLSWLLSMYLSVFIWIYIGMRRCSDVLVMKRLFCLDWWLLCGGELVMVRLILIFCDDCLLKKDLCVEVIRGMRIFWWWIVCWLKRLNDGVIKLDSVNLFWMNFVCLNFMSNEYLLKWLMGWFY